MWVIGIKNVNYAGGETAVADWLGAIRMILQAFFYVAHGQIEAMRRIDVKYRISCDDLPCSGIICWFDSTLACLCLCSCSHM